MLLGWTQRPAFVPLAAAILVVICAPRGLETNVFAADNLAAVCLCASAEACADETRRIGNDTIQAAFALQDGAWRLTQLARLDGTDALDMTSDEFEILLFDGRRFTVDAYRATGVPNVSTDNGAKTLGTVLRRKTDTSPLAPEDPGTHPPTGDRGG